MKMILIKLYRLHADAGVADAADRYEAADEHQIVMAVDTTDDVWPQIVEFFDSACRQGWLRDDNVRVVVFGDLGSDTKGQLRKMGDHLTNIEHFG